MNNCIIKIFDVEHGSAALLETPNGKHVLFDCGTNSSTGFTPSAHIKSKGVILDKLVLSHADQDHITDIEAINAHNPVMLTRNRSVSPEHIRAEKIRTGGKVDPAVERYIEMHNRYTGPAPVYDWGGVEFFYFHNELSQELTDLNDLSLVAFVRFGNFEVIFPGDLSKKGWQALLYSHPNAAEFRAHLSATKLFIASHHGREDGYDEDVFLFCKPELVVFSDKDIEHDTQKTIPLYQKHVKSAFKLLGDGNQFTDRYVVTTRSDGMILIMSGGDGFMGASVNIQPTSGRTLLPRVRVN